MALNLKKLSALRSGTRDAQEAAPTRAQARQTPAAPTASWHGRKSPPPPRGSNWDQFVDWASEGSFDPHPEDTALAMKLWRVLEPRDDDMPSAPSP